MGGDRAICSAELIEIRYEPSRLSSYCSIQALIDATGKQGLVAESNVEENVQCVALFDNVGPNIPNITFEARHQSTLLTSRFSSLAGRSRFSLIPGRRI